jgi:hypothetical protein
MIRLRTMVAMALLVAAAATGPMIVKGSSPTGAIPQPVSPSTIVIIVLENAGLDQTYGSSCGSYNDGANCTYITNLANSGGFAENYSGVAHSSLPNYLTLLSGANYSISPWISTGCGPGPRFVTSFGPQCGNLNATTIIDQIQPGFTWKAYVEDYILSGGCFANAHGVGRVDPVTGMTEYEQHHVPFLYFASIAGTYKTTGLGRGNGPGCENIVNANGNYTGYIGNSNGGLPTALLADLNSTTPPNLAWLAPNDCNNGHDDCITPPYNSSCTAATDRDCVTEQDTYLSMVVPKILGSRAFQTGPAALMITEDEGNHCPSGQTFPTCTDQVATIWAGSAVRQSYASKVAYSQYSLAGTLEALWSLPETLAPSDSNMDIASFQVPAHSVTTPYPPMLEFFKAKPSINTVAPSPVTLGSGQNVTDNATLTGGYTPTGTITYSLYNDSSCTNMVFASTQPVGTPSAGFTPTSPGNYSWIIVYNGDSNNIAVSTGCGEPVTVQRATPNLSSSVSPSSTITASQSVTDQAVLWGGFHPTGNVTYSLYSDQACTLRVYSSTVHLGTQSGTFTPSNWGTYEWTANYTGDIDDNPVSTSCGSEPLTVTDFNVTASPASLSVPLGSNSTSTITLTSLGGFTGNIELTASISNPTVIFTTGGEGGGHPLEMLPMSCGLNFSLSLPVVSLVDNGTAQSILTVSAPPCVSSGIYLLIVNASQNGLSHSLQLTITVPASDPSGPASSSSSDSTLGSSTVIRQFNLATITLVLDSSTISLVVVLGFLALTLLGSTGLNRSSRYQHRQTKRRFAGPIRLREPSRDQVLVMLLRH